MRFKVLWKYQSSLGGRWEAGEMIDIAPDLAEAINRDSPGVLEAIPEKLPVVKEEKPARVVANGQDRMVRGSRRR